MGAIFKLTQLKNSLKKLNICLVYPGYPPYEKESGGISSYVQENVRFLTAAGHNVIVISRTPGISHIIETNTDKTKIIYLPHFLPRICKFFVPLKFNKFGAYFYSYKVYKLIKKLERKNRMYFDVIETSDWGGEGYFFVKKFPARTIIKCDTPSFIAESYNPNNPAYLSSFVKKLEQRTLLNAKNIVTNSKILMQKICAVLHKNLPFTLVQLSMKTIPVQKTNYKENFSKNTPMNIIFSGRIEERKGIFDLIDAIKQLRKKGLYIELHCFGATTPMKHTDSITLLKNKGYGWLHFYGQIPREQIIKEYKNNDLCVVPSVFDSFCLTALEALLSKIPTIVSDTTGISDLISDKFLVFSFPRDIISKIKDVYFNYASYARKTDLVLDDLLCETDRANIDRMTYYFKIVKQNNLKSKC